MDWKEVSELLDGGMAIVAHGEVWTFEFIKRILIEPEGAWHFPIGTEDHPPAAWYVACVHDMTGAKNRLNGKPYPHTGIDYNLDRRPWGDIDQHLPVWAVADGVVHGTWHSERNLGSVVIKVVHEARPLWVRYWHLDRDSVFLGMRPGQRVFGGQRIGRIGDYFRGDHLHFDMARKEFHPGVWFTNARLAMWVDPVPILKAHLPPAEVEESLRRE